ncbi:hypothetical protein BUALT_Bualt08G0007600 [Buddleja alternifolia]|uniref:GRF-type domain-containing protein n=1 Tax=Buddleja alternifolia TaxID=168488 RepID=A0AAV6XAR8_9LAMI|nr:hypothetical protein BUALT_Bualt08G0007600 [Buddleja alternifolia]
MESTIGNTKVWRWVERDIPPPQVKTLVARDKITPITHDTTYPIRNNSINSLFDLADINEDGQPAMNPSSNHTGLGLGDQTGLKDHHSPFNLTRPPDFSIKEDTSSDDESVEERDIEKVVTCGGDLGQGDGVPVKFVIQVSSMVSLQDSSRVHIFSKRNGFDPPQIKRFKSSKRGIWLKLIAGRMKNNSVGGSRSRGSSSYSSHTGVSIDDDPKYCGCGVLLHIQTSRTKKNSGRRFKACPIRGERSCQLFKWLDDDIPPGTLLIIRELEDHSCELSHQLNILKRRYQTMVCVAAISLIVLCLAIIIPNTIIPNRVNRLPIGYRI